MVNPYVYVGASPAPGPPAQGTYAAGNWVTDGTGVNWVCVTGGTPGTWDPAYNGLSMPLPTGVPAAGNVPVATGAGEASAWGPGGSGGSGLTDTAVKTSAYTAAAGDMVLVSTASAPVTITTPASPASKQLFGVKHAVQNGTNAVTVAANTGSTFNDDASASLTLPFANQSAVFQYNSSLAAWVKYYGDMPLTGLKTTFAQLASNLSDLPAPATALANLGGTAVTVDGSPVSALSISSAALVNTTPSIAVTHAVAAMNYDPLIISTSSAMTTGIIYLQRLHLDAAATVSSSILSVGTAITGATTGNLIGLYDDNGNLLAISGSQSAIWASTGIKDNTVSGVPFTTPYVALPGWYNVALLTNGSTGAGFYRSGSASGLQSYKGSGSRYRFGLYGTAQTTLPGTIPMASVTASTSFLLTPWVGLQ